MRELIAEIGSCNGDIDYAVATVDAFNMPGVVIKGQLYQADTLVTRDAASYGRSSITEKATQYEAFTDALSYDDWGQVAEYCKTVGVEFFASVFDHAAVDAGVEQGWSRFKIASADITYKDLIQYTTEACLATDAQLVMSTGAATLDEIVTAREWVEEMSRSVAGRMMWMVCTLSYPTLLRDARVNRVTTLKALVPHVGYSDHTLGIAAAQYAYKLGAESVEKHVTIAPGTGGDHDFAITPDAAKGLVGGYSLDVSFTYGIVGGSPQIEVSEVEQSARRLARRSWHAVADIKPGDVYTVDNVAVLRPADGLQPATRIIGTVADTYFQPGEPIR